MKFWIPYICNHELLEWCCSSVQQGWHTIAFGERTQRRPNLHAGTCFCSNSYFRAAVIYRWNDTYQPNPLSLEWEAIIAEKSLELSQPLSTSFDASAPALTDDSWISVAIQTCYGPNSGTTDSNGNYTQVMVGFRKFYNKLCHQLNLTCSAASMLCWSAYSRSNSMCVACWDRIRH